MKTTEFLVVILLITLVVAVQAVGGIEPGGMPNGAKPVRRCRWNLGNLGGWGRRYLWGTVLETENVFPGSDAAARLARGQVFSTNMWSSYDYGEDDHTNVLKADWWCTLTYYAENVQAIKVQFFNATQQRRRWLASRPPAKAPPPGSGSGRRRQTSGDDSHGRHLN